VFRVLRAGRVAPILWRRIRRKVGSTGGVSRERVRRQSGRVEDLLDQDAIDLAVFLPTQQSKSLMIEPLGVLDTVLVAREGHPKAGIIPFHELVQTGSFAALNLSPSKLKNAEKLTVQQRFKKRDVITVPRISAIPQLVAATELLAFIPALYAREVAPRYGLQVIEPPVAIGPQQLHMTWHRRNAEDQGLRWLREALKSAFSHAE